MPKYAGADWVQANICGKNQPMSWIGRAAADVLGDVFCGIYHLNRTSLNKADWTNTESVGVTVIDGLSTFDGDHLTRLVVLCHDRMLRVQIDAAARGYLRLWFHQRTSRTGRLYARHPTMETAIATIRQHYGGAGREYLDLSETPTAAPPVVLPTAAKPPAEASQFCPQCRGCGAVADSDDQEPWSDWLRLPVESAAAVTFGIVKPISCPRCGGTGIIGGSK